MDILFNTLNKAQARSWTTTEESDISCHPSHSSGWLWVEDDYAVTQAGDKVEPIEDNLYRVTWNTELMSTHGEFSVFTNLQHVLEILG